MVLSWVVKPFTLYIFCMITTLPASVPLKYSVGVLLFAMNAANVLDGSIEKLKAGAVTNISFGCTLMEHEALVQVPDVNNTTPIVELFNIMVPELLKFTLIVLLIKVDVYPAGTYSVPEPAI